MAYTQNPDTPNGARPVGTIYSSHWTANLRVLAADGSGSDIFRGDLVNMESDGYIDQYDGTGTADVGVVGVFMGVSGVELRSVAITEHPGYYDNGGGASSNLLVCMAPGLIVEMQEDGDTTPLTLADVGANVEVTNAAGNTTTGISGQEIDSSSATASATLPLQILRLVNRPTNQLASVDTTVPNARWLCIFSNVYVGSVHDGGI